MGIIMLSNARTNQSITGPLPFLPKIHAYEKMTASKNEWKCWPSVSISLHVHPHQYAQEPIEMRLANWELKMR